jgi:hypothetical protein
VLRRVEIVVVAVAIAVAIALAVTDPGSDRQRALRHDVEVVRRAADGLAYPTVADAWRQDRSGASAALSAIVEGIDVRYLSTYQDGDAIILTFQSRSGDCIDLVSRPGANTVETHEC